MSSISSVILAAGPGIGMKSDKAKVTHEVCFTPIINHVYSAAKNADIDNIITVVGSGSDQVIKCLGEDKKYAFQGQPLGTGHAVWCAMSQLSDGDTLLVLSGDVPLVNPETLKAAIKYHFDNRLAATVISASLENPSGYGRILRDENLNVKAIIEEKNASALQKQITEVNSGLYCFDIGLLRAALSDLIADNSQPEYYLTDTIEILLENGYSVGAYRAADSSEIFGINNRVQLASANAVMRKRINKALMLSGVTIIDSKTTYIGSQVSVAPDTIIYPGTVIKGKTVIESGCIIGPGCMIDSCAIGKNCEIISSVITDSAIKEGSQIGPFACIRSEEKMILKNNYVPIHNLNIFKE